MAPQIIAFDRAGNVVKSWNVSVGAGACDGYRCLNAVHEIYVDHKDNVWISGNGDGDSQILKFDYNGKFLLQIGGSQEKECCGNQDKDNVGGGTGIAVWPATNEVFVSDGYVNRRVVVFDADTGKFKRMWGAYGHQPPVSALSSRLLPGEAAAKILMDTPDPVRKYEGEGPDEWSTVHSVAISPDGIVWIADRNGNRIQQFKIDGTYIREAFVNRKSTVPAGTVYHFSFSPDLKYVYVPDGSNKTVHILERESLKEVGSFGNCGGQMPGCFNHLHVAAIDSAGNVYTGEAATGARVQKWKISK
jgi:DNA-binding beta-propeller fold protein YncE